MRLSEYTASRVLEIYRITLLSNICGRSYSLFLVLEIYRITLLSNEKKDEAQEYVVLEIYRITLLSNLVFHRPGSAESFRDLQNYTTLKQHCLVTRMHFSFRDLQNYTTLKPQIKFEAQE